MWLLGRLKSAEWKQDEGFNAVKFAKKHEIINLKLVDHLNNEKRLLARIVDPFKPRPDTRRTIPMCTL